MVIAVFVELFYEYEAMSGTSVQLPKYNHKVMDSLKDKSNK